MIGTFALVFAGCGSIVINTLSGDEVTHLGVGMTFGLVVAVMIYATGHISGAHFNPVVTLAFASLRYFPWRQVPHYVAGQLVAALTASLVLRALFGNVAALGATEPSASTLQAFVLELILTFFLMFVITAVSTDSRAVRPMAGSAIGATAALAAIFAGPISGASMNPARSLGPAVVSGRVEHLWIYLLAPIAGAALGAWAYRMIRSGGPEEDAAGRVV